MSFHVAIAVLVASQEVVVPASREELPCGFQILARRRFWGFVRFGTSVRVHTGKREKKPRIYVVVIRERRAPDFEGMCAVVGVGLEVDVGLVIGTRIVHV